MAVCSKLIIFDSNMWIIGDFYPSSGVIIPITAAALILGGFYLYKHVTSYMVISLRDATKNHHWKSIKFTSRSWYCSVCEALLINGVGAYCDCCGVCADPECLSKVNKLYPCKAITSSNEVQLHHWVKGNLPLEAICDVCKDDCATEYGLIDYRCCWCQRCVHEYCISKVPDTCDFGSWKNMLVPPWCVQVARRKSGIHRHLLLRGVKDPGWENWSPLIVVANRKSGNNDAALVLEEFRKFLNPAQVIDLADRPPAAALQWCVLLAPKPITILAAGGDGTVAWVLTTAYKMDLDPKPIIGIIPLGTGNDLSRVLGWGKGTKSDLPIDKMVNILRDARTAELDRWKIEIIPTRHLGIRFPMKSMYMYNYFSIGVDAQVTLDFHKTRHSRIYIFQHRIINKLLYLCFGTQQFVTADCKDLDKRVDVYLDGVKAELPELESIVILNIPSWGAGVDLWHLNADESAPQSYNDGLVEVLGIYSSFHIAQLQVGMSTAHRIGQARNVEIHLKGKSPVQLDGEPWEQHPANIKITAVDSATVLVNSKKKDSLDRLNS